MVTAQNKPTCVFVLSFFNFCTKTILGSKLIEFYFSHKLNNGHTEHHPNTGLNSTSVFVHGIKHLLCFSFN